MLFLTIVYSLLACYSNMDDASLPPAMTPQKLTASRKSGTPSTSTANNGKPPIARSSIARKMKPAVASAARKQNSTPSKRKSSSSNAPASCRKKSSVSKKARTPASSSSKKAPSAIASASQPRSRRLQGRAPELDKATCDKKIQTVRARRLQFAEKAEEKRVPQAVVAGFEEIQGLGVADEILPGLLKTDGTRMLWDFGHVITSLQQITTNNPDKDVFVFKYMETISYHNGFDLAHVYNNSVSNEKHGRVPLLVCILMPKGRKPPPFIGTDNEKGEDGHDSMDAFELDWFPMANLDGVFALQSTANADVHTQVSEKLAGAYIWSLVPHKDMQIDRFEKLKVSEAHVVYKLDNGTEITEPFSKVLGDKINDWTKAFLSDHSLEAEHEEPVRQAIKDAFERKRALLQAKIDMLAEKGYDKDMLTGISTAKIYPQNAFLKGEPAKYVKCFPKPDDDMLFPPTFAAPPLP